jgi:hypothetical protein
MSGFIRRTAVERRAAEHRLVAVGVAVERLAHAVGERLALVGLEPAGGDRGHGVVEIIDENRRHGAPRAIGVFHDVDRPVLSERPHRFGGVREERRLAQQSLIPRSAAWKSRTRRPANRCNGLV